MKNIPNPHQMDVYRQQMLEMYRQSTPSAPTIEEENWLDERYPPPDILRDKESSTTQPASEIIESTKATENTNAFVGYLRVFVFTAGGAEPIAGARVVVTQSDGIDQTIYANLITDRDGFTPIIALPSVDPALTLQPDVKQPFTAYKVRVSADGFQTVEHHKIPVYGDNYVTQPVAMLPLRFDEDSHTTQEFTSGGPTGLNGGAV